MSERDREIRAQIALAAGMQHWRDHEIAHAIETTHRQLDELAGRRDPA